MADGGGDHTRNERLLKGPVVSGAIMAVGALVALVMQLVLARWLGVEAYGVFSFVFTLIIFIAVPASLGAQMGMLRYVPRYLAKDDWGHLRGVMRFGIGSSVIGGVSLSLLGAVVVYRLGESLSPEMSSALYIGFLVLPLLTIVRTGAAIVRGFGQLAHALIPNLVLIELVIVLGVVGCVLSKQPPSATTALLFVFAGACVSLLWLGYGSVRGYPQAAAARKPAYHMQAWMFAVLPLLIVTVSRLSFDRMGVLMVGGLSDSSQAGLYALAARLSDVVIFPLAALNAYFAPRISRHYAKGDMDKLQVDIRITARWVMAGATIIALPCLLFPEFLLSFFGQGFAEAAPLLQVLVLGQWLAVSVGSVSYLLSLTAYEKIAAVTTISAAVSNVLLLMILIPIYGAFGAALAFTLSLGIMSVMMAVWVYRHLGVVPGIYASLLSAKPYLPDQCDKP